MQTDSSSAILSLLLNKISELQHELHTFAAGDLLPCLESSLGGGDGLVYVLLRRTLNFIGNERVIFWVVDGQNFT